MHCSSYTQALELSKIKDITSFHPQLRSCGNQIKSGMYAISGNKLCIFQDTSKSVKLVLHHSPNILTNIHIFNISKILHGSLA